MLKWMKLKNLAIVEEAEIQFGPAFNVITGETGAGKSVIMGGVGLLLGERADKSAIRIGADCSSENVQINQQSALVRTAVKFLRSLNCPEPIPEPLPF